MWIWLESGLQDFFKNVIYISIRLKAINILSVTLNLKKGFTGCAWKLEKTPVFINSTSNHHPSIYKHILASVLSANSSYRTVFSNAKTDYKTALTNWLLSFDFLLMILWKKSIGKYTLFYLISFLIKQYRLKRVKIFSCDAFPSN